MCRSLRPRNIYFPTWTNCVMDLFIEFIVISYSCWSGHSLRTRIRDSFVHWCIIITWDSARHTTGAQKVLANWIHDCLSMMKALAWHLLFISFPVKLPAFCGEKETHILKKRDLFLCTLNRHRSHVTQHVPSTSLLLETTSIHETWKVLREEPAGFDFIPAAGNECASSGPRRLSWASSPLPCFSQAGN